MNKVKVMNMTVEQKVLYCIAHEKGDGCIFGKRIDDTIAGSPCLHCVRDADQTMIADYIRNKKIDMDEFESKENKDFMLTKSK